MSGVDIIDGTAHTWQLSYQWACNDAGRAQSRRPKQHNDCTVRALAAARHLTYDAAYDILAAAGRVSGQGFKFGPWINAQPWAKKMAFPARRGEKRMTLATFVHEHSIGCYICKLAKHVVTVRDGIVFDDRENAPDRCVYTAWKVD